MKNICDWNNCLEIAECKALSEKDKKNNSKKINLVLLRKIGQPVFNINFNNKKLYTFLKTKLIN